MTTLAALRANPALRALWAMKPIASALEVAEADELKARAALGDEARALVKARSVSIDIAQRNLAKAIKAHDSAKQALAEAAHAQQEAQAIANGEEAARDSAVRLLHEKLREGADPRLHTLWALLTRMHGLASASYAEGLTMDEGRAVRVLSNESQVRAALETLVQLRASVETAMLEPLAHADVTKALIGCPDGHPKLLHSWPPKLLQAGRNDYAGSAVMTKRAAASLSR